MAHQANIPALILAAALSQLLDDALRSGELDGEASEWFLSELQVLNVRLTQRLDAAVENGTRLRLVEG